MNSHPNRHCAIVSDDVDIIEYAKKLHRQAATIAPQRNQPAPPLAQPTMSAIEAQMLAAALERAVANVLNPPKRQPSRPAPAAPNKPTIRTNSVLNYAQIREDGYWANDMRLAWPISGLLSECESIGIKVFTVKRLPASLLGQIGYDTCCTIYSDVWLSHGNIGEIARATGVPTPEVMRIALAHELGHQSHPGEEDAWFWARSLVVNRKLASIEAFGAVQDYCLSTYNL